MYNKNALNHFNSNIVHHKIVFAAPPNFSSLPSSSTPKITFDDVLALGDSKASSDLDELLKLYECSRDVIGGVIGEGELKPLYEKYKHEFDVVLQNDLVKCGEIEDIAERAKFVF